MSPVNIAAVARGPPTHVRNQPVHPGFDRSVSDVPGDVHRSREHRDGCAAHDRRSWAQQYGIWVGDLGVLLPLCAVSTHRRLDRRPFRSTPRAAAVRPRGLHRDDLHRLCRGLEFADRGARGAGIRRGFRFSDRDPRIVGMDAARPGGDWRKASRIPPPGWETR